MMGRVEQGPQCPQSCVSPTAIYKNLQDKSNAFVGFQFYSFFGI